MVFIGAVCARKLPSSFKVVMFRQNIKNKASLSSIDKRKFADI